MVVSLDEELEFELKGEVELYINPTLGPIKFTNSTFWSARDVGYGAKWSQTPELVHVSNKCFPSSSERGFIV